MYFCELLNNIFDADCGNMMRVEVFYKGRLVELMDTEQTKNGVHLYYGNPVFKNRENDEVSFQH